MRYFSFLLVFILSGSLLHSNPIIEETEVCAEQNQEVITITARLPSGKNLVIEGEGNVRNIQYLEGEVIGERGSTEDTVRFPVHVEYPFMQLFF